MLEGNFNGVSTLFQGYSKYVFFGCFMGVSRMFKGCLRKVSIMFQACFNRIKKKVSKEVQGGFKVVSRVCQEYSKGSSLEESTVSQERVKDVSKKFRGVRRVFQ